MNNNKGPGCEVRGCFVWIALLVFIYLVLCILSTNITIQKESPWVKIELRTP